MPFFESASEYRISGVNYQEVRGDSNEHHQNNSVRVNGQGNAVIYNQGSQQNGSGSGITNNCGSMTIIGQGDNARIHLSSLDFQGNNGFFQMPPYPQVHVSMPQNEPRHAAYPYPHQGPGPYFDPRMGQPQHFVPEQTMYQSNISYVNQFPTAHAHPPSTANYAAAGPMNMAGTQNPPSWGEPPRATRSAGPIEHPVDFNSFYSPVAPSSSPMMPMPSPAQTAAPLHIPSPASVPDPFPARAPPFAQAPDQSSLQIPIPSQSPGPNLAPTSPVEQPSIQFPHSPRERIITPPPTPHSPVRYAEVHPSPSDVSQNAAHWNSTTPYSHRAIYQPHADETLHTTLRPDEAAAPHSATASNPIVERRSERIPSPSPSHRSSAQRPSEKEAPQSLQKLQFDTVSSPSNQIASASAASTSTPVAVRSPSPQEDRVSAQPSEKTIRGVHEAELSLESMPPPAYSLEAETPFQTGEISQESTSSVMNSSSNAGLENLELRYSPSTAEVVRQEEEEDCSMPDIILPKKKKKTWSVVELFRRRSRKYTNQ